MSSNASASRSLSGFHQFDLGPSVLEGIERAGFSEPRPIQEAAISAVLEGRDVLGLAQTGTGKTAAFALPIIERLLRTPGRGPRVLIVAPTRELANQIDAEFRMLAGFTPIKTVTVFGGVGQNPQVKALRRRPEVIVACPGRLLDLYGQGVVDFSGIEALVLDEADHMFDMGFLPDIRRIIKALPRRRQNLLFSATMPREIRGLADDLLRDPHVVELAHAGPAETIDHALYPVDQRKKRDLLEHLIAGDDFRSAIVFTRTKHRAKRLAKQLHQAGHSATDLQGNLSQNKRDRAMRGFRDGRFRILVATDIAARGIDVAGVSHVINFDIPDTPDAYVHRIGRTGRAERDGQACTFMTGDDRSQVRAIERKLGTSIRRERVDGFSGAGSSSKHSNRGPAPRPATTADGSGRHTTGRKDSMSKSIYVGNLPFSTSEPEIEQLFEQHGTVERVNLILDRETGRSRGFAFVEMPTGEATAAIDALQDTELGGRTLRINEARPRT